MSTTTTRVFSVSPNVHTRYVKACREEAVSLGRNAILFISLGYDPGPAARCAARAAFVVTGDRDNKADASPVSCI